jgi:hypothetical protein
LVKVESTIRNNRVRAIRRSPVPLCICRVPGVLQAEQTESGQTVGNDRVLAVCAKDKATPQTLADVDNDFLSGGRELLCAITLRVTDFE